MCIIVYKPVNVEIPVNFMDTLHNCFENNSDGTGMMSLEGNEIKINKGFMTWKSFKKAYKKMNFTDKDTFLLHFRIATHGNIDKNTCHPFPISDNELDLKATTINTQFAFAHNGIINLIDEKDSLSDSMLFVKDILSQLKEDDIYNNKTIQKMIQLSSSGSKLMLWSVKHGVLLTGKWENVNDIYFSNTTYQKAVYTSRLVDHKPYNYLTDYSSFVKCDMCGEYMDEDESHKVFNDVICDDCYNQYFDDLIDEDKIEDINIYKKW